MAIILDADVIIRGEKGTFDLQRWVAARPDEQFEVAAVTVAELWHGVERAAGMHKVKRQHYLQTSPRFVARHSLHGTDGPRTRPRLGGIGIIRQDDRAL